ncbi:Elongation of very long chain fatty acids like protein [Argiope bruennichi]|uniref:Elongation of very long chain fatty acids protein n=2 Tax=Argiope bruennichi TaxID=94029 RepID=A0A8T0EYZ1_ARGBR|nr:Elongation of very long chain fatty acids like protein [Argiope bruennichi]
MERFEDYWSGGDPVTMNRFLTKTITPMITIVTSYVLFVTWIGPTIMKNKKPIEMRKLIIVYNFGLIAFYLYFLLKGAFFIPELGFQFICGSLNSYETPIIPDIFDLGYQLYVVRYIELLDTVFLVLTKKFNMVTPLHVFHHSIVPVFGWFGFRSESSGYLAVFMAVNCIVHIVMYTYYAIAALGPKYQKYIWWKKYLTSLQILQFFVMTFYTNIMFAIGCTTSKFTFMFCTFLSVLFFFLFINYYKQAYKSNDKEQEAKKNGDVVNRIHETNGIHSKNVNLKNGLPAAYRNAMKKEK